MQLQMVPMRVVTAAGLAVDAWVHADLAGGYSHRGHTITQGDLFLVEAAVASAAALLVLIIGRWQAAALALVVAATALAAVVLYRYVNVGALGPLPNMYEPAWYAEKTTSAIAEAAATLSAAVVVLGSLRGGPRRGDAGWLSVLPMGSRSTRGRSSRRDQSSGSLR